MVPYFHDQMPYRPLEGKWYEKIFQVVIVIAAVALMLAVPTIFFAAVDFIKRNIPTIIGQSIGVALTFAFGVCLYRFRCRKPGPYGMFECIFGVLTAVYVANRLLPFANSQQAAQAPDRNLTFAAWCGAIYVIVRGLDNYHRSLIGTPGEMRWKRWFFNPEPENRK